MGVRTETTAPAKKIAPCSEDDNRSSGMIPAVILRRDKCHKHLFFSETDKSVHDLKKFLSAYHP